MHKWNALDLGNLPSTLGHSKRLQDKDGAESATVVVPTRTAETLEAKDNKKNIDYGMGVNSIQAVATTISHRIIKHTVRHLLMQI